jgi:hypothetical protein
MNASIHLLTEGAEMIFFLPSSRPNNQTDRITNTIRKTSEDEMLRRVERVEICSPCEDVPLATNVRNKAIQVRKAAKPLKRFENGETTMAAMAPIQTRTVKL